jgi:hypothetical protein
MSELIGTGAAAAVAGFAAGARLSDVIKGAFASIQRRSQQRAAHVREMRKVVMTVNPEWDSYTTDLEWTLLVGLTATVKLENHSDQLIRNIRDVELGAGASAGYGRGGQGLLQRNRIPAE